VRPAGHEWEREAPLGAGLGVAPLHGGGIDREPQGPVRGPMGDQAIPRGQVDASLARAAEARPCRRHNPGSGFATPGTEAHRPNSQPCPSEAEIDQAWRAANCRPPRTPRSSGPARPKLSLASSIWLVVTEQEVRISLRTIQRMLAQDHRGTPRSLLREGPKPWRSRSWIHPRDPIPIAWRGPR
jgi:hypothetical protein